MASADLPDGNRIQFDLPAGTMLSVELTGAEADLSEKEIWHGYLTRHYDLYGALRQHFEQQQLLDTFGQLAPVPRDENAIKERVLTFFGEEVRPLLEGRSC